MQWCMPAFLLALLTLYIFLHTYVFHSLRTLKQILSVFCLFKNPKVLHRQHDLHSLYTSVSVTPRAVPTVVHACVCLSVCLCACVRLHVWTPMAATYSTPGCLFLSSCCIETQECKDLL